MPAKRTLITALPTLPSLAPAHGPWRGPNGGQMQDIGSHHGGLPAQDGRLTFAPRPDGAALIASRDGRAEPGRRVVVRRVPAAGQPRIQARCAPIEAAR